jgi:hypothetical protein
VNIDESEDVDVLALIDDLAKLVLDAKSVPLSDQLRIDREPVYDLLDQIRSALPDAVKEARQIVKDSGRSLGEAQREQERLIEEGRGRAERELSETAIGRLAERQADQLLAEARRVAHELTLKVDEWAERILATLEPNFERLLVAARRGRDGLTDLDSREDTLSQALPPAE